MSPSGSQPRLMHLQLYEQQTDAVSNARRSEFPERPFPSRGFDRLALQSVGLVSPIKHVTKIKHLHVSFSLLVTLLTCGKKLQSEV